MPIGSSHPVVKAGTIVLAITLMSGFVLYRHHYRSGSALPQSTASPVDSPETKAVRTPVHIDSFYMDPSMPSSKSGMVIPPEHPAFDQQQVSLDSSSTAPAPPSSEPRIILTPEDPQRRMLYSSKSGTVFEIPPSALVNDSALKDARTPDTLR